MYEINNVTELPKNEDIRAWLLSQVKKDTPQTLLAFADDGVIWGLWDGKDLVLAPGTPALRGETLQQAYLFNETEEIRLFHDELNEWKAKSVSSAASDKENVIVEKQILWGDKKDKEENQPDNGNFTRLLADRKGIPPQTLPITKEEHEDGKFVRLEVHHLVDFDEKTGEAYIKLSRLAGLSVEKKNVEVAK
jgi:CRISPR-associated protein (TIGR03984 family)